MKKTLHFCLLAALVTVPIAAQAQYIPPSPPPAASSPRGVVGTPQASVPNVPQPPRPGNTAANVPPPPPDLVQSQVERDIMAQSDGKFPVMERSASYSLGALQKAWNSPFASTGQATPGVMRYIWRPDYVMAVRTREYMVTTINLPAWEQVTNLIVGDPVVFEAKRIRPNILAVRPSHAGADTNVTVIGGSGNVYSFYIRSEGWNSDQVSDITIYVDANRPANVSAGGSINDLMAASMDGQVSGNGIGGVNNTARITPPDYVREIAFKPENLKFDMKILAPTADDAEIAPERVFNDGIWTYFDFGKKADSVRRPVIYQVIDGVDTMVNTRTAGPTGSVMIAETVGEFTLRNGNRIVCVHRTDRPLQTRSTEFNERMRLQAPSAPNQVLVMRPPQPAGPRPDARRANPSMPSFLSGMSNWFSGDAKSRPPVTNVEK
jgi:ComB9 competence protein